ncbi:uncharacterized protein LOC127705531 [Mytilus californianus]|uniref:uncharacterized protein LOC127705531 n=1 Tax=Mytilus californianus TaxID=6549 RepID=UPI002247E676|nr:uncharacterized protein LOC127705531 [Mytilus californianus]
MEYCYQETQKTIRFLIMRSFYVEVAENVLTDNDFMFDSSKRAIRASRHIIGQVLVDSSVKGLSQQQQPKAMPPRPKLRKPKLKEKGIETASSSCTQDIHWLFISVSAKTCLQCQSLTSAMCDDFDTMPMTITRGFSSWFDVHVKHKLKEVIEMTELQGSASYYSAHWRHIRWITGTSLAKHMEMREDTAGICERQNIFGNTAGKEVYALVLAEFSEWKIKSIQRLGFTHRHYLTVKDSINNSKLQATPDKM